MVVVGVLVDRTLHRGSGTISAVCRSICGKPLGGSAIARSWQRVSNQTSCLDTCRNRMACNSAQEVSGRQEVLGRLRTHGQHVQIMYRHE